MAAAMIKETTGQSIGPIQPRCCQMSENLLGREIGPNCHKVNEGPVTTSKSTFQSTQILDPVSQLPSRLGSRLRGQL